MWSLTTIPYFTFDVHLLVHSFAYTFSGILILLNICLIYFMGAISFLSWVFIVSIIILNSFVYFLINICSRVINHVFYYGHYFCNYGEIICDLMFCRTLFICLVISTVATSESKWTAFDLFYLTVPYLWFWWAKNLGFHLA